MKHIFLFFFLVIGIGTQAQFKKINFNKDIKITAEDIKIQHTRPQTTTNTDVKIGAEYKSISSSAFLAAKNGLKAGSYNERKVPTYIEGSLLNKGSRGTSIEGLVNEYLVEAAPLMKIKDPTAEFTVQNIDTDELGITHVRCQQVVKNIPIYGAEVIVHGKGQTLDFLNGRYYPSFDIEKLTPSIAKEEVMIACKKDLGENTSYDQKIQSLFRKLETSNELVIYPYDGQFTLAYHITTYRNLAERWEYFIDANKGKIINKYQSICKFHNHVHTDGNTCDTQIQKTNENVNEKTLLLDGSKSATALDLFNVNRNINTYQVSNKYYLIDGARDIFASAAADLPDDPNGVIWTIDAFNTSPQKSNFNYDHVTSSNNTWTNKTSVSAHYNGGKAFEYYRNVHGRKSINGDGGNIVSLINVADDDGSSMGNAYWNGAAMFYGNGDSAFLPLARGLDVAGHEMTHGVVQSTANLEYQGESGALNESFADVFGVLIDRDDWKIGEDVVKTAAFPSGALRDMQDPHNGAATNDFNKGWQPKIYSERYKGTEDNGGVHLNSGIPNHAFYLFATAVGKDKAEKVYYRALSTYLTKSSQFVDCRVAVIKAATDLYTATEINAAKKAFSDVGILGDSGGSYEVDNQTNPGKEYVLSTSAAGSGLTLHDATTGALFKTISSKDVKSKPSISDNGSEIVFISSDDHINYIYIDWTKNPITVQEAILSTSPVWRNAIISKDGLKIAGLTTEETNEITVFEFSTNPITNNTFTLYNPTFSEGVSTGDVNYADAMEFDVTGEYIMYDAENEIKSNTSGSITYWDISFIKVWNNDSKSYSLGKIEKLYSSLPEDVSVGNPTFSKNSPYIIAFDYIDATSESIYGANIERGDSKLIYENDRLAYPNYSSKDNKIVFDTEGQTNISTGVVSLKTNKIEKAAEPTLFLNNRRWATWFSNGKRDLSSTDEESINEGKSKTIRLVANPVIDNIDLIISTTEKGTKSITISDITGKAVYQNTHNLNEGENKISIRTEEFTSGQYFVTYMDNNITNTVRFVKIK